MGQRLSFSKAFKLEQITKQRTPFACSEQHQVMWLATVTGARARWLMHSGENLFHESNFQRNLNSDGKWIVIFGLEADSGVKWFL